MSATPNAVLEYRFARFRLLPHEQRLLFDDEAINVGPRAFSLLVVLVEHAGELVTKDAIFSRVWPGLVVEENNIQVQISALRKILGHEAIVTIPGVGYRFVLPLATGVGASSGRSSPTEGPSNGPATHGPAGANLADRAKLRHSLPRRFRSTVPAIAVAVLAFVTVALWLSRDSLGPAQRLASSPPAMSIAVLPFAAPSGGAIEQGLSEALSRDLPAVLARTTRYARVTSPDLTTAYAGKPIDARSLGRELNVRYLVIGEVRIVGEQIVHNSSTRATPPT